MQILYKNIEFEQDRSPGYLLLVTGPGARRFGRGTARIGTWTTRKKKKKLGKVLNREEIAIAAFSVFLRNGYMQHPGA